MSTHRISLVYYLTLMSETAYQLEDWINAPKVGPEHIINFFYDDTTLADDPEDAIGYILKDEIEVEAIKSLIKHLDLIENEFDWVSDPPESLMKLELWKKLGVIAKQTLEILSMHPETDQLLLDYKDENTKALPSSDSEIPKQSE